MNYIITRNYSSTAKESKVDRKVLRDWVKKVSIINDLDKYIFRFTGGNEKVTSESVDSFLEEKIKEKRPLKINISKSNIISWALEFTDEKRFKILIHPAVGIKVSPMPTHKKPNKVYIANDEKLH